ncbi:HNH endonuclease [Myxococcus sp. AM011]
MRGRPELSNGLSLCELHHGAFDADQMGIRSS